MQTKYLLEFQDYPSPHPSRLSLEALAVPFYQERDLQVVQEDQAALEVLEVHEDPFRDISKWLFKMP